jgi:hypothetical protein
MALTEEQRLYALLSDPIAWAESTLRDPRPGRHNEYIKLRFYQKEILANKSRQKVLRLARRLGKSIVMAVNMLWYAMTHRDSTQLAIAPYDAQILVLFDTIQKFIDATPILSESVIQRTKSPHYIKFGNGSIIKGFTAGTNSGNAAGGIRGQGGDIIYIDEADYLDRKDFDTIYGMRIEEGRDIQFWMASTPTGRREHFYEACTGSMLGWQEFHYNITVHPEWGPEMEAQLKSTMSELGYIHEFLAEFGDEEVGVFKKEYVERATFEYRYTNVPQTPAIRIITADWDKYANATQILVTEFDRGMQRLRTVNRIEVPQSQFTLTKAVNKIIELNEVYNPEFIYLDRGYGEGQIEFIKLHGMANPETGLHTKTKGIHFGDYHEITDPYTKEVTKVPLKVFMVNQLVNLFEKDKVAISSEDTDLIRQLNNYRVVKKTKNNLPIFNEDDEHIVDCLSLACLALVENYPQLIDAFPKIPVTNKIFIIEKRLNSEVKDLNTVKSIDDDREERYVRVPLGSRRSKNTFNSFERGKMANKPFTRKLW